MPPIDPIPVVLALAVMTVGAAIQGSMGFGLAIIAAPILVIIDPRLVPGPVLAASLCLTLLVMRKEHASIDFRGLTWGITGRIAGTGLGLIALSQASPQTLSITVGAMVLAGVLMSVVRVNIQPTQTNVLWAGVLSGLMGTTASLGGPPLALIYQNARPDRIRSTLGAYFLIGSPLSLAALALGGRFGWEETRISAMLIPGVIAGYLMSRRLIRHVDRGRFRSTVIALCALAGITAIVKGLW